jgi:hypothetical protein
MKKSLFSSAASVDPFDTTFSYCMLVVQVHNALYLTVFLSPA